MKNSNEDLYLIYFNDYLSIEKFAEDRDEDPGELREKIDQGRKDHFDRLKKELTTQVKSN